MKPEFSISDNSFKVILPNVNYKDEDMFTDTKTSKEKVIDYLNEYGKVKRETIDKLFNISSTRSKVILSELLKEKIIEKVGTGKNTYYILK